MTHSHSSPLRRIGIFLSGAAAAGALAWSVSAFASSDKPTVSVKIDDKPVEAVAKPEVVTSFAPVIKQVTPSVVTIMVSEKAKEIPAGRNPLFENPAFREFFGPQFGNGGGGMLRQPAQEGLGSGVIVSKDGYILTNNHVVQDADTIKVRLTDGRELTAKVVGTDPDSDVAVVKVDATDLPAITFADSEKLEVGDRVLAIGNPFGIGQTVTGGMVSGLGRATMDLDYQDFIQTDAAINPGNSGGALVDVAGRLVGVNTAILSRSGGFQGVGFAIPSNLARNVMEQLVNNGKVVRGYIGVMAQDLTPALAEQFDLKDHKGALVAEISPNGPAEKAGLKNGDVITAIDGHSVEDARHLKLAVADEAPNSKVSLSVMRDGKQQDIDLTVGTRPGEKALASNGRGGLNGSNDDSGTLNGVGVTDLDPRVRREFDIPSRVRGALITEVSPDSAAASAGLEPGDVIQEINRAPVQTAEDAIKLTENPDSKKTLLRIWNQQGTHYVMVDETGEKAS